MRVFLKIDQELEKIMFNERNFFINFVNMIIY